MTPQQNSAPQTRCETPGKRFGVFTVLSRQLAGLFASVLLWLDRLGRRTWVVSLGLALIVVALQVASAFIRPLPQPNIHDEYSALLEADTLAHGRLTNQPHRLWEHFEAVHILVQPSYTGKYPLGAPAFLALGQRVFGHPFWGVVIGTALAVAASAWAIRAWTSPAFSIIGGLQCLLACGTGHYWARSYYGGGSVLLVGSMLVIGGYRRLVAWKKPSAVWPLGIGVALLLLTRPFEGGVLIFASLLGIAWDCRDRSARIFHAHRTGPAVAALFIACVAFQALANRAATGSAFRMAYMEHSRQYDRAPAFWFMRPDLGPKREGEVRYQHDGWELQGYFEFARKPLLGKLRERLQEIRMSIPWPKTAMAIAFTLTSPWLLTSATFLCSAIAASSAALFSETWYFPHYGAPLIACLLVAQIYVQWLLARSKLGLARLGRIAAVTLALTPFASRTFLRTTTALFTNPGFHYVGTNIGDFFETSRRQLITRKLEALPGWHVVIVRRSPKRSNYEWVYNSANIDQQKIIWAQDLGPAKNQSLFDYYNGRQFWLLEPDIASGSDSIKLTKIDPP